MTDKMKKAAVSILTAALLATGTALAGETSATFTLRLMPRVVETAEVIEATAAPAPNADAPEKAQEPLATPVPKLTYEEEAAYSDAIEWKRDENGNLVLDENGNPEAVLGEGEEVPVAFEKDENGNLVLDENGNPMVKETAPAGSDKMTTIHDELDPNRSIDIYVSWNGQEPAFGGTVTMTAVLNGYGDADCRIQWQRSADNASWADVPGGAGSRLSVQMTEENYLDYWRVAVTIAEVQ